MMPVSVSVIIPTWNGREHLEICLESLRNQQFSDFEIILVDNGSTDGSQSFVRDQYAEVILVELNENRGFTGACNAGFAKAKGEIIALLNNDTEADPGWLSAIVHAFETHPEIGIVASKILLFDKRDHFHAAGDYYRVDGIPGNRGVWQRDQGQYDQEEYVFSASGAASAYRRAMIERIGFLDEIFYFSCEDLDISWRAHMDGWHVLYVPTAIVYHKVKATGGNTTSSFYDGRNFLYLIWKNYPASLLRRYWYDIFKAQLSITWKAIHSWRGAAARARIRGQLSGLLGIFRMLPSRRAVQANRRVPDDKLMALLSPVDETCLESYDPQVT